MARQSSYSHTRERLEEIVTQIKAKDIPLEKSLDLYEEALRLGSDCAELIDQTDFSAEELENAGTALSDDDAATEETPAADGEADVSGDANEDTGDDLYEDDAGVVEEDTDEDTDKEIDTESESDSDIIQLENRDVEEVERPQEEAN